MITCGWCNTHYASFDSTLGCRARGQPVWVLHVPRDPTQDTLYPPIK